MSITQSVSCRCLGRSGTECVVSVCRRVGAPAPGAPGAFGPRTTCTAPMVGSRIMVDRLTLSLTYVVN